jgi:hypothetical protein
VDAADGRELAEQHTHRMAHSHLVVAEGEQQHHRAPLPAPREVPDQVQRGCVRPVHVLDQPDSGLGDERRAHGREQSDPVDRRRAVGG